MIYLQAISGFWIKFISVVITSIFIQSWGLVVYNYEHLPDGWKHISIDAGLAKAVTISLGVNGTLINNNNATHLLTTTALP